MIPGLALIVAATGVAVCCYVIARSAALIEGEYGRGVKVFATVAALVALLAIAAIALGFVSVIQAATQATDALRGIG